MFAGLGGGFYNRGDIVVDGESYFSLNAASVRLKAEGRNACIDCGSLRGSLLWALVNEASSLSVRLGYSHRRAAIDIIGHAR